ncbi:MAG TPA: hypothetical protein VG269_11275 [Tepidisphaeraceae bacterium]|jgi:hypothetical protein|nr:hypothetical protein [Tepidisphaeraceae bacterium]
MDSTIGRLAGGLLLFAAVVAGSPSPSRAKLAAAPSAAAQADAKKSLKELFQKEYADRSAGGRQALARALLRQAASSSDDPGLRFVLLTEARDFAAEAGDVNAVLFASGRLVGEYEASPTDGAATAFSALRKLQLPPVQESEIAIAALRAIERTLADGDIDGAVKIATAAEAVAPRTGDPDIIAGVRERVADVRAADSEYRRLTADRKTLADNPDDPKASLAVGKFLCFQLGRWDEGLDMLARASDPKFQKLAKLDKSAQSDPRLLSQAAEGWAGLAETSRGLAHGHQAARANSLYRQAIASLTGLEKIRAMKAVDEGRQSVRPWESTPLVTTANSKGLDLGRASRAAGEQFLIQLDVKTTASGESVLLTKRLKPDDGSITVILESSGCADAAGDGGFYRVDVHGKTVINDGLWHTITIEKQGRSMKLFVDYAYEGETNTLAKFASASPWTLGWHGGWERGALDAEFRHVWIEAWK